MFAQELREGEQARSISENMRVRGYYSNSSKKSELAIDFSDAVLQVTLPPSLLQGRAGAP